MAYDLYIHSFDECSTHILFLQLVLIMFFHVLWKPNGDQVAMLALSNCLFIASFIHFL